MASDYELLSVFGRDYPGEKPWELLEWCSRLGADEFTVTGIRAGNGSVEVFEDFDRMTDRHRRVQAPRRHLNTAHRELEPTDLWSLNADTTAALRRAFPRGFFNYFPADAWFEDLNVYRRGDLMLGVITHEAEGILRVTSQERSNLQTAGFPYELRGQWVGY